MAIYYPSACTLTIAVKSIGITDITLIINMKDTMDYIKTASDLESGGILCSSCQANTYVRGLRHRL